MAATAEQIAELRRLVAEPVSDDYPDELLASSIEAYPLMDERGEEPFTWDTSTTPPTKAANPAWIETYDLMAAAADIWAKKAAELAADFDFEADGHSMARSQAFRHAVERERYFRSRRSPKTATLIKWPKESNTRTMPWIGNLPEPGD